VHLEWLRKPVVPAAVAAELGQHLMRFSLMENYLEPAEVIAFLAKRPGRTRVLVVGHEPDLSELAARLIGAGSHANLGFKKGGCCMISFEDFPPRSPGQLTWWLTPRLLRKLR